MNDIETLRGLAKRWMEFANLPIMTERKRQWTALKDLKAERPMMIFETAFIENYVKDEELNCSDPFYRDIEKYMRRNIRHVEEVGDDIVLNPEYRVYWDIEWSDYGFPSSQHFVDDGLGSSTGFSYDHPIKSIHDIDLLKKRSWKVNRQKTRRSIERLEDAFGEILPVVIHGHSEEFHCGITKDLFILVGNDNLLKWVYDQPEAIHEIMAFIRDDRLAYFNWLERENLLGWNNDWGIIGAGSPGATTALHDAKHEGCIHIKDLWIWMESQETTMISPGMFERFFLPYMAEVCSQAGLVYYGCCEPLQDRWDLICKAIPNIRAVSISGWSDQRIMGEKLGRNYVYSRKPKPWLISIENPDWDAIRKDLRETLEAARDCNLEIIYRDIYRIYDHQVYPRKWADLVRVEIN